ncbi:hypothetical protein [uncultured Roseobacter sp.]|uniref:hypothetical protein n=1 Tax=uncultured Roseobacter sp. TaxID=114847 RepID=UPI00261E3706|nr:hypothetical protein [uncultured Roseobacter sp.]
MINVRVLLHGAALMLATGPVMAADRLELVSLEDKMLAEPRVTAEAVFVGLVWPRREGKQPAVEVILAAFPPGLRSAEVCVRVTTEDGRYSGNARYRETRVATSSLTLLPYAPEEDDLSSYEDTNIAVLAFPCESSENLTTVAVASWASDSVADLGPEANLLVNSFRATSAFLIVGDTKQVDCISIMAGERAAYDFSCPIPIADIKSGARIALYRTRGTSLDPEVAINIVGWE